jgi:hypothetical protein
MHLVPRSSSCLRPWLDQLSPSYAPEYHFCNVHLTCDVHHVSIIQFLDHHICSLVLNPVRFTLSTCSTLSTLVSPLIELSSKHQNSQESFQHVKTLAQTEAAFSVDDTKDPSTKVSSIGGKFFTDIWENGDRGMAHEIMKKSKKDIHDAREATKEAEKAMELERWIGIT